MKEYELKEDERRWIEVKEEQDIDYEWRTTC